MPPKEQKRRPIDFDVMKPDLMVTDPERAENAAMGIPHDPNYPAHLTKPVLEGPGGSGNREIVLVENAADERRLRAQGYMNHHEADLAERKAQGSAAAAPAKPRAARKPANRVPKPVQSEPAPDVVVPRAARKAKPKA